MSIPLDILLTAVIGLQGWILLEIIGLKTQVAILMDEHESRKHK
jgi:hypothetical protein